ncbi:hypothetical protein BDV11DRAFT_199784 [Aspergillus similis]
MLFGSLRLVYFRPSAGTGRPEGAERWTLYRIDRGNQPPTDRRPSWPHCASIAIGAFIIHYTNSGRQRNAQRTFDRRKGAALARSLEKRPDISPLEYDAYLLLYGRNPTGWTPKDWG